MGKINWGRVLAGGLLAGVVLNVVDFVLHGVILGDRWNEAMAALGKPAMTGGTIFWFVLFDFGLGIFLVWLYAAIRPRYGVGPRTAAIAGFSVWVLLGVLLAMAEAPMGLFPTNLYVVSSVVSLFVLPLAAVAGAWLYKEL